MMKPSAGSKGFRTGRKIFVKTDVIEKFHLLMTDISRYAVITSYETDIFAVKKQEFETVFVEERLKDISIPEARINKLRNPYIEHELGDFSSEYCIVNYRYVTRNGMEAVYRILLNRVAGFREKPLSLGFNIFFSTKIETNSSIMEIAYKTITVHAILL